MKLTTGLLAMLVGIACAAGAQADTDRRAVAPPIVARVCASCHGIDGNGTQAATPNLAGLQAQYLVKQMRDYVAGKRRNETSTPCGPALDPDDIPILADWFSAQPPAAGKRGDPALSEQGRKLYEEHPDPGANDDCMDCHKAEGRGGSGLYPRVAGQPAAYTLKQMLAFKSGARNNDTSKVMRESVEKMSEQDMRALAEYLAGK